MEELWSLNLVFIKSFNNFVSDNGSKYFSDLKTQVFLSCISASQFFESLIVLCIRFDIHKMEAVQIEKHS